MPKFFARSLSLLFLTALLLLTSCGGELKRVQKSTDTQLKYNAAVAYYKAGTYLKALPLFEELLTVFRGTEKAQDIYYYYAYCNYHLGDYVMAQFYFSSYYRTYPHTSHAEECEFMRAYCAYLLSPVYSLDQTETKKAIEEFQTFIDDNPNSARLKECNKYIDLLRAKLERKYFEIAKQYYTTQFYNAASTALSNYIKSYPNSKYVEESAFLVIKADYEYAINSVIKQKSARLQKVIDDYTKFAALFPKSEHLKEAQNLNNSASNQKKNL
jgi:outer membrane protein assembly factor BamD